jgi:hypothetical protein
LIAVGLAAAFLATALARLIVLAALLTLLTLALLLTTLLAALLTALLATLLTAVLATLLTAVLATLLTALLATLLTLLTAGIHVLTHFIVSHRKSPGMKRPKKERAARSVVRPWFQFAGPITNKAWVPPTPAEWSALLSSHSTNQCVVATTH